MNLEKMRKQHYRKFPDSDKKYFDPFSDMYAVDTERFIADFGRKMRAKHGEKLRGVAVYQSEFLSIGKICIQAEARLW